MPRNRWPSRPLEDRFWEKVRKGPDCWVWVGAVSAPGQHGRIWVAEERRKVIASRVSWTMHNGPIPDGMEVCHRCDNPPCVRPDHLFLGTHRANMRDASDKGRAGPGVVTHCRKGHVLAETAVVDRRTGRRRCVVCRREGQRRRRILRHKDLVHDAALCRRQTPEALRRAAETMEGAMG
jgi:hypothetical protein